MAEAPYAGITRSGSAVGGQPATLSARSSELPRFVGMTLPRRWPQRGKQRKFQRRWADL